MTHHITRTPTPAALPENLNDAHAEILRLRRYVEYQIESKKTIYTDGSKKIAELKAEVERLRAELQRAKEAVEP
jgi:hypothetical protein